MAGKKKGKISFGTVAVLAVTLLVLGGCFLVWNRLSDGRTVDLSKLRPESLELTIRTGSPEKISDASGTATPKPAPTAAPATDSPGGSRRKTFTLTAAGTVALEGEVRKNGYYSEAKQYDYYDIMMLLKKELQSDINIVFTENLFMEEEKVSDLISSGAGCAMLKAAGFNIAAGGFSKAFNKGEEGISSTRKMMKENGITPIGIFDGSGESRVLTMDAGGVRTAVLQYTDTVAAATRKNMIKNGTSDMVPAADPETIAADIARAREEGAEAVLVFLNWGKTGKAPDKNMRTLAQQIADAGADLIIGNGSRIVSGAEKLTAGGSGKEVLCVWSLGTTLSGDRTNIKRIAGMLLQATVSVESGHAEITEVCYIPVYTWKYKQDSRFYYRCLAADRPAPDGMDQEQQKMMNRAAETIRNAMKDSPVEERKGE
jgi:poly-gamma-glutamate synthesis protein (capsule biosynthesis protein)